MVIRRLLRKRVWRKRKGRLLAGFSGFTIFLIGFILIWRILSVVPLTVLGYCEYQYFWVENWQYGTSNLQLFIVIICLVVAIATLNLVFATRRNWVERALQIGFSVLFLVGGITLYTDLFPYGFLARAQSSVERVLLPDWTSGMVLQESMSVVTTRKYQPEIARIVKRAQAEMNQAYRPFRGYYLIIRTDNTWEILVAPEWIRVHYFRSGNEPTYAEMQAMRKCVADNMAYRDRKSEIERDDTVAFVIQYGYIPDGLDIWRLKQVGKVKFEYQ